MSVEGMTIDIRTWPVERAIKLLHDTRSAMTLKQHELVEQEKNLIAGELRFWLTDDERLAIKNTAFEDLYKFSNLARDIRNEYELWIPEHHITKIWHAAEARIPILTMYKILGEGSFPPVFDDHPCHPDNFSFSCVQRLWKFLNPEIR